MTYKVGDKFTYSKAQPGYFDGVLTVQSGEPSRSCPGQIMYTAIHPVSGLGGFFENNMVPYVDPMTDQQLADKYRELREEAQNIWDQLTDRGYKLEARPTPEDRWGAVTLRNVAYRFSKIETVTTTL